MILRLTVYLMLFASIAPSQAAEVDDPDTVAHLRAIHETLGTASQAITACVNEGGDRRECLCGNQNLVREFHATVKTLVSKHPEIAEQDTVRFKDVDGSWVSQNIPALIRQAENPPSCS